MSDNYARWLDDGKRFGWEMPCAPWWKRLPLIRNIRFVFGSVHVARHNRFYRSIGLIPTGYDHWVLYGILYGLERSASKTGGVIGDE